MTHSKILKVNIQADPANYMSSYTSGRVSDFSPIFFFFFFLLIFITKTARLNVPVLAENRDTFITSTGASRQSTVVQSASISPLDGALG